MMALIRKYLPSRLLYYIVLTLYAAISTYPFLWMVSSALKSNREVYNNKSLIPNEWRFDILINSWNELEFFKYSLNSLIIALATVFGIILIYSMAGYGFAKTQFWGRDKFFLFFLAVLLGRRGFFRDSHLPTCERLRRQGFRANRRRRLCRQGLNTRLPDGAVRLRAL
jgi:ABC-type glycerol-3-phosphate transport system permease component